MALHTVESMVVTRIIAVTGTQGSGKSVFTGIANKKYQIPTYRLGNVIIQECKERGMAVNGRNMAKMASILRFEGGNQAVAQKALPAIRELYEKKPKAILIDGIRSFSELSLFREAFGEVTLVAIISTLKTRRKRIKARKRLDHKYEGDFEEREQRELGFGLGNVITKADYYILNENLTKEQFINEIERLLQELLK